MWSISSLGLCRLGSSARAWGSGVQGTPKEGIGHPGLVRVSSSVMDAVCACLLTRLLRRVAPRFSCPGLFVGLALARARGCNRFSSWLLLADTSRACRLGSQCAVRLFRWMGVWGVLVGLIAFPGFVVRPAARPPAPSTAPVHRPCPLPPSTAPPLTPPTPQPDPKPAGDIRGHSCTSPMTPTANRSRSDRETRPCGVLERFLLLLHLLCFTSAVNFP